MILPRCKEVSTALARGDYADAGWLAKAGIRLHLLICSHCRRFKRQLGLIAQALKTAVLPIPSPESVAALQKAALARLKAL